MADYFFTCAYPERCYAIAQAVGKNLTVEIWHQSSFTRDILVQTVRQFLGISELSSFPYKFPNLDLTLDIQACSLGELGDALQLDPNITDKKEQRRQAIRQRSQEVEAKVSQASSTTVAFIELDGADRFSENTDPKDALRRGFACRGRWTQFISTDDKKLSHRALNGFLDLLRQLGVQSAPPQIVISKPQSRKEKSAALLETNKKALPEKLNYVALWMVKQNSSTSSDGSIVRVPVMVYMASDTTEIKATAPGLGKNWLPYRDALLKIGRGEAQGFSRPEEAIVRFVKPKLSDVLSLGDTLLLCHAQNLRSTWRWLTNGNITRDRVAFGEERLLDISRFNKNLRIVRLRDSQGHETPEWYAQKEGDEDKFGFSKGIFQMGDRVFASTYNTPKQFQLNRNLSKGSYWKSINRKKEEKMNEPSPNDYYWNPGLIEMTVACIQPNDDIFPWAAIAHELRHLALHHDEPLQLPLPLHLAKLIEEYVLLINNDD